MPTLAVPILAESKLPALIIAHLTARQSDADYPTPAITMHAGPFKGEERSHPSLEVWVSNVDFPRRRDEEQVDIMVDFHTDKETTLATDLANWALILRALAGGPTSNQGNASNSSTNPFLAYCNGLSDPNSAGWQVDDLYIVNRQIMVDDKQRIIYRAQLRATFRSFTATV